MTAIKKPKKLAKKGPKSSAATSGSTMSSNLRLEVTDTGVVRVTILDQATRETIYMLATGGAPASTATSAAPLEFVVRYATNPGVLLTGCPGGPGGSQSQDTCCPC